MTIRKEIKSQIVNIRGKIKCLPKDSMGTGGTSGGLIWPMRDEVVDGLTNIIRKLDEGDISLDNNGSDSNTSCSSLTWVTYYLDKNEYVSRGQKHVPIRGDIVQLFGSYYVVVRRTWIESRGEESVKLTIESVKRDSATKLTLGMRNNNPGNIINDGTPWEGLSAEQSGPFYKFKSAKWGIRAMARNLMTYSNKHAINTISGVISRWAPPTKELPDGVTVFENDTKSYIAFVSKKTGIPPDRPIDLNNGIILVEIISAIIFYENGSMPYSNKDITDGIALAG